MYIVQQPRFPNAVASTMVGATGQLIVDMGLWTLRVHDGVTIGGFALLVANNNLGDLTDASAARGHLGLGSAATQDVSAFATSANLAAEVTRAEAAEVLLQTNITAEATTRATADTTLTTNLAAEVTRAEAAEALCMLKSQNLNDLADKATARTNLNVPQRDGTDATGNWGINITGSSASCSGNAATATSATSASHAGELITANWTLFESGGNLYFQYQGVNKARIDSGGNIYGTGNVGAAVGL